MGLISGGELVSTRKQKTREYSSSTKLQVTCLSEINKHSPGALFGVLGGVSGSGLSFGALGGETFTGVAGCSVAFGKTFKGVVLGFSTPMESGVFVPGSLKTLGWLAGFTGLQL